jgi:ankyrin repeat protein
MSKLSGIRDLDREIFSKVDDDEILKACSIDKYTWNIVCDDAFLKRRLKAKYPEIEKHKVEEETWKKFYLRVIHHIALMKEKFGYEYTFGDFVKQNKILKKYYGNWNSLLFESSVVGDLALVIWSLKSGGDIHYCGDSPLRMVGLYGHLEIAKYLVENGADIHAENNIALKWASTKGHLEVVKYLVGQGADIHASDDSALRSASLNGHLEIVKYLVENGADNHSKNGESLELAHMNEHFEIENYLKSKILK